MLLFRQHLQSLSNYSPSTHPLPGSPVLKFNCNENPYPPSPAVIHALQQFEGEQLRRYPDPTAQPLRAAVGKVLAVPPDWLLVGNGSDELLGLILQATIEGGDKVVYPMPSYPLYRRLAHILAAETIEVAFNSNYELPLNELVTAQGKVTFVAAPNNPSGTPIALEDLHRLASQVTGLLIIDEAYVDFAETDALPLVHQFSHVVILRTLSKGYSLAGLRLGFAVAQPELIAELNKVRVSYSVDAIACHLGTIAIQDQAHKIRNAEQVKRSRTRLTHQLTQLGFRVWPSQTNFLMVQGPNLKNCLHQEWMHQAEPSSQTAAAQLQKALKQRGILVRHFNLPGIDDKLRITVGTEEQNEILCGNLAELIEKGEIRNSELVERHGRIDDRDKRKI